MNQRQNDNDNKCPINKRFRAVPLCYIVFIIIFLKKKELTVHARVKHNMTYLHDSNFSFRNMNKSTTLQKHYINQCIWSIVTSSATMLHQ